MCLFTDEQIKSMTIHAKSDALLAHLQAKLQRNRTLAMWHDHSTILIYLLYGLYILHTS